MNFYVELEPGEAWADQDGLELPEQARGFLERAGGVLRRQVYGLRSADGQAVAVGIHRPGTAQETLGLVTGSTELYPALLEFARERAFAAGALSLKLAAPPTSGGQAGDRPTDTAGDGRASARRTDGIGQNSGQSDGRDAGLAVVPVSPLEAAAVGTGFAPLRAPLMGAASAAGGEPLPTGLVARAWPTPALELGYCHQTTLVTCGPIALLMALEAHGLVARPDRAQEIGLWREATTMPACDPYGLALAAARLGASPRVVTSTDQTMFNEDGAEPWQLELRGFVQDDFRRRATATAIPVSVRDFGVDAVREEVAAGRIVVLLIDELAMHGVPTPHWIVVHGLVGEAFAVEDPWFDDELGETWIDAHELIIPAPDLDQMARWGAPPYRAMLSL
ncbi:MAG: peptidase C39 family protein [Bifidobacteriaceae bacterium]|nr:peptidase C39 family protein [Bifidobacteriaceae bacterium]